MSNPYRRAWSRRRRNRAKLDGAWAGLGILVPLGSAAGAAWLAKPVFMGFLVDPDPWVGAMGLALRLGWLCCAAMSIRTYSALVRSPERTILDAHPADPPRLLRYLTLRCGWEGLPLLLGAIVLTWPVFAAGQAGLALAMAWVVLLGWSLGLLVGLPVHLASVWVAESPALAGVLEVLRGSNPRLQTALIYAPGAVLLIGGVGTWFASVGVEALGKGVDGALWTIVPFALMAVAFAGTAPLARRWHFRTTLLLAEIDARYAGLEDAEEARWVYMQWTVRVLPVATHMHVLKELRHGWRGHRSWVSGAWAIGILAAIASWTDAAGALERSAALGGAGMVLLGGVGVRLATTNPMWLDQWLDVPARSVYPARFWAIFCWLQAIVFPAALALTMRQGAARGLGLGLSLELLALLLALLGTGCGRFRGRGWLFYLPPALLGWGGLLAGLSS